MCMQTIYMAIHYKLIDEEIVDKIKSDLEVIPKGSKKPVVDKKALLA